MGVAVVVLVICGDEEMREKRAKGKTRVCFSYIDKINNK